MRFPDLTFGWSTQKKELENTLFYGKSIPQEISGPQTEVLLIATTQKRLCFVLKVNIPFKFSRNILA